MSTKSSLKPSPTGWTKLLDALLKQIEQWAKDEDWPVSRKEKTISEEGLGTYRAGVLDIKTPSGWLVVDPVAYSVAGGEGRVDLYSFPSLNRVWLLRRAGRWIVRTDSGIDWPKKWGRKTFIHLARELTAS